MMPQNPRVSVVLATYNRSHLLRSALVSLRESTHTAWEALVVGDHCTDDSEAVAASFADSRIRFINLPTNSGQQATPNNVGISMATGDYLAFLNQDDLYLPHHLAQSLEIMEATDAELVLSPYALVTESSHPEATWAERVDEGVWVTTAGYAPDGKFKPMRFHVTSSWVMRRAVADRVGPWRLERSLVVTPSREWLFRAWRKKVRLAFSPEISVVAVYSGQRKGSYIGTTSHEHQFVLDEVVLSARRRAAFLEACRIALRRELAAPRKPRGPAWFVKGVLRNLLTRLGVHPLTLHFWMEHGGRGKYVAAVKRHTGAEA